MNTSTIIEKQFCDDDTFKTELSFSIDNDLNEQWVVLEQDSNELSLSLTNWKKLVEMANELIKKHEKK